MFDFHFLVNIRPKFDSWTMETVVLPAPTPILSSWGLIGRLNGRNCSPAICARRAFRPQPDSVGARDRR
jgi:hypothetical protein